MLIHPPFYKNNWMKTIIFLYYYYYLFTTGMMQETKAMLPHGVRKVLEDLVLAHNFNPNLQMLFCFLIKLHFMKAASTDVELTFKQRKPEILFLISLSLVRYEKLNRKSV